MAKAQLSGLAACAVFLSIWTQRASSFPEVIAQGYFRCGTCHIHHTGNTYLNDYGRAMSADFMSTWSTEDEASIGEIPGLSLGADYRHLFMDDYNAPMKLDFGGAFTYSSLTTMFSAGYFSRSRRWQSRENWIKLALPFSSSVRAGFFMPDFGINTNDHNLAIKRIAGLSRGSETYNLEWMIAHKRFQASYTSSINDFRFHPKEAAYRLGVRGLQTDRLKLEYYFPRYAIGLNYLTGFKRLYGIFFRVNPKKDMYLMLESSHGQDEAAFYGRIGWFAHRGIDTYFEFDKSENLFSNYSNLYFGLDWMVRPRFRLSLKLGLGRNVKSYYQTHLWL